MPLKNNRHDQEFKQLMYASKSSMDSWNNDRWMMKSGTTYSSITGRIGVKCIVDSKPTKQKCLL